MKPFLYLWVIAFSMSSCIAKKHIYDAASTPDYNGRVDITNPKFERKTSSIGVVATIGCGVAGGYIGYTNPFIYSNQEGKSIPNEYASAAVGTLAGTGICLLANHLLGHNTVKAVKNDQQQEWIAQFSKKNNANYSLLRGVGGLKLLDKQILEKYTFRDYKDVEDYRQIFKREENLEAILERSMNTLSRDDLKKVISLYPFSSNAQKMKARVLQKSSSYSELWADRTIYPDAPVEMDSLSCGLITQASELKDFLKKFPNSAIKKRAVVNSFKSRHNSAEQSELSTLLKSNYTGLGKRAFENEKATEAQYMNYWLILTERNGKFLSLADIDEFVIQNKEFTFSGRALWIVESYFRVGYPLFSDGDELLYRIRALYNQPAYQDFGVHKHVVEPFITEKLKEEIARVAIDVKPLMAPTNTDFEKWMRSSYTSSEIVEDSRLLYLAYGTITNNSKFSLPISVASQGDLYFKDRGTLSTFRNTLITIGGVLNGTGNEAITKAQKQLGEEYKGTWEKTCEIGWIKPNGRQPFANLLDFGTGTKKGYNWNNWVKVALEYELRNPQSKVIFSTLPILTTEQKAKQKEAYNFAKNGLPAGTLFDEELKQSYSSETWKEKHQEHLAYMTQLENERQGRKREAERTGKYYSVKDIKDKKEYSCNGYKYKQQEWELTCNCGSTRSHIIYYWPTNCDGKIGFYEDEWGTDGYLGANEKELNESLMNKCDCK